MSKTNKNDLMEKIVSLCKRRGFVFPGSEIYGGLANSWDYGPLGVGLKNNLRDLWWRRFVQSRDDMVGIDAAILMNSKVWETSGHLQNFADPLVECDVCHSRFRYDAIMESQVRNPDDSYDCPYGTLKRDGLKKCGGKLGKPRQFNLMFKTAVGTTEEKSSAVFLRPEIAQAMFVNFKNVLDTSRKRLPFGIASIGKAFRNEITPGNFIFRTLEFDLMEFEYFIRKEEWEKWFDYWLKEQKDWLKEIGFDAKHLRIREHEAEERAHYSRRTVDIEYNTPFGWKEMFGLAYRADYDLKNHTEKSGTGLEYTDPETGEKLVPHVIEPTFGLTRLVLMTLLEAYQEDPSASLGASGEPRVYLKLKPYLAPYQVAVFPLLANKPQLIEKAREIYQELKKPTADCRLPLNVVWDDRGNIGKRYYSQDEIGTPFCVTIDFDTLENETVTVRDRDTAKQERVKIEELRDFLSKRIWG